MNKITGILMLLVYVCVATAILNPDLLGSFNMQNVIHRSSLFGIIAIAVAFVIITGGIDLSIGSLIGLVACVLAMAIRAAESNDTGYTLYILGLIGAAQLAVLAAIDVVRVLRGQPSDEPTRWRRIALYAIAAAVLLLLALLVRPAKWPAWIEITAIVLAVIAMASQLGLVHGLLITKLNLQPFVVTLCGLMCYRGLARTITRDKTQGFGTDYDESLRLLATSKPFSFPFLLMVVGIALAAGALVTLALSASGRRTANPVLLITVLVLGAALTLVGSSVYWGDAQQVLTVANAAVGRFAMEPGGLMRAIGLVAFFPCLGWLILVVTRKPQQSDTRRTGGLHPILAPLLAVMGATVAMYLAWRVALRPNDYFVSDATWGWRLKLASVFSALGILIGAVLWFFRRANEIGGARARPALLATSAAAILFLAGQSEIGQTRVPAPFIFLVVIGALAGILLNRTIYGRYLLAMGRNENAARFSGVDTDRMKIMAYVLCAGITGVAGVLFALDSNVIQPSGIGSFYELYAIAAAVLGGCSLRGGEGSILGVIIGASVMRVLYNAIGLLSFPSQSEFLIIGLVILAGVIVDELVKRRNARQRALLDVHTAEVARAHLTSRFMR